MSSVCLYFKVHQPFHLKPYLAKELGEGSCYKDVEAEKKAINRVADECYLPANELMQDMIKKHSGNFKISYSISGTTLELLLKYRPDVIRSFKRLADTGCVEMLGETYYHSFCYLRSGKEFQRQVNKHFDLVDDIFGLKPKVFRNTELIYDNHLSNVISSLGFEGILCEGVQKLLSGRTPNKLYAAPGIQKDFSLLLRNARLSDDIAFRFGDEQWDGHPLTASTFAEWINAHPQDTEVINLFMDYETFGIHKKKESGIFDFLKALPDHILTDTSFTFNMPSEVIKTCRATDIYNIQNTISWEDSSTDDCVWNENVMQNNALKKIYSLENIVLKSNDERIKDIWGRLQSADYFYYMADGSNRENSFQNFKPFETPKEAFKYYMNIVTDFEISLIEKELKKSIRQQIMPAALFY
ncbi:MAG: glycoside hydrolase family 57 protein [Ginsengibacter sp.]